MVQLFNESNKELVKVTGQGSAKLFDFTAKIRTKLGELVDDEFKLDK
jgi:hypothetical protein